MAVTHDNRRTKIQDISKHNSQNLFKVVLVNKANSSSSTGNSRYAETQRKHLYNSNGFTILYTYIGCSN